MQQPKQVRTVYRQEWIFGIFLVLFSILFVFAETNNGRWWTSDFRVYYEATRDFFAGNNPYVHAYGLETGFFKYPPFMLYLFSPNCCLGFAAGQLVHQGLLVAALLLSFYAIRRILYHFDRNFFGKSHPGWLYLSFLCVGIHVVREFHLGNVNLLLLVLLLCGLWSFLNGSLKTMTLCWGLMLILKPIMIPVILPLMLHKGWKVIVALGLLGVFFLLFPVVHLGFTGTMVLWLDWFKAVSAHGDYLVSTNTIRFLASRIGGDIFGLLIMFLAFSGCVWLMVRDRLRFGVSHFAVIYWSVFFTAAVPSFFLTDTEHFLLSLPLIYLLLVHLQQSGSRWQWVFFFSGMLCFSFDSTDLLGRTLSDFLFDNGFLGMGNLIWLGLYLYMLPRIRSAAGRQTGLQGVDTFSS